VAILRDVPPDSLEPVLAALVEGGITVVEITLDSEDAFGQIRRAAEHPELLVGAGTVASVDEVDAAARSGARFCAAPTTSAAVVRRCAELGLVAIPGALTPTEIAGALELGAPLVKLFPAGAVGPAYLRELRGPLPHAPLVATGGIDEASAGAFLEAGAAAVGIGSALVSRRRIDDSDWADLARAASRLRACV
jgi:2-dehydro-3-deoxyphosphogluconate aldolase/(4S)-4-hydroxy-2-oxoglutarate aldolase